MPTDFEFVLRWTSISLFGLLVPTGVFIGRMNVRISRRGIVRDLECLLQFAKFDGRPLILPSFEFVKYKYDPDASLDRATLDSDINAFRYYLLPVAIYVILTFLFFLFTFTLRVAGGAFTAAGAGHAAYQRGIYYFMTASCVEPAALTPAQGWPASYAIDLRQSNDWGECFYFGEPGGPPAPPVSSPWRLGENRFSC
jgi:hypothetical protein